jgi:hypothetical protein
MIGGARRANTSRSRAAYQELAREAVRELQWGQRAAARLQQDHPSWTVMYGWGSRQFWAWPMWPAAVGHRVSDADPAKLNALMSAAELAARRPLDQAPGVTLSSPVVSAAEPRRGDLGRTSPPGWPPRGGA